LDTWLVEIFIIPDLSSELGLIHLSELNVDLEELK